MSRGLAEIRPSAFQAESMQNRQSFSEFHDLATVSRTFEGEANVLGIVAALSTRQKTNGSALATEVKEVPAPNPTYESNSSVRRPPRPDPLWLSPLMRVRTLPQNDLDRFGNPRPYGRHHFDDVCGEIPKVRLPRMQS